MMVYPTKKPNDLRWIPTFCRLLGADSLPLTWKLRLLIHAPGLTPSAVWEKLKSIQIIDVHLPTGDGRKLILPRYTQPEKDAKIPARETATGIADAASSEVHLNERRNSSFRPKVIWLVVKTFGVA